MRIIEKVKQKLEYAKQKILRIAAATTGGTEGGYMLAWLFLLFSVLVVVPCLVIGLVHLLV